MSGVLSGVYAILEPLLLTYGALSLSPLTSEYILLMMPKRYLSSHSLHSRSHRFTCNWFLFSSRKARKYNEKLGMPQPKNCSQSLHPIIYRRLFHSYSFIYWSFWCSCTVSLIFYGLALIQGSANMYDEVRYLGFVKLFWD